MSDEPFTCPKCGRKSWHPEDKRQGYCGACHEFTGACNPATGFHVDPHKGCILR